MVHTCYSSIGEVGRIELEVWDQTIWDSVSKDEDRINARKAWIWDSYRLCCRIEADTSLLPFSGFPLPLILIYQVCLSGLCRCGPLICPSVCYSAFWVLPEVWIQWCKGQAGCSSKGRTESFKRQVIKGSLSAHTHQQQVLHYLKA